MGFTFHKSQQIFVCNANLTPIVQVDDGKKEMLVVDDDEVYDKGDKRSSAAP
jgi:hypothetical protein